MSKRNPVFVGKKWVILGLIILLPIVFTGCKEEPVGTDQEKLEEMLQQNDFFESFGKTPKGGVPNVTGAKGDTAIPDTVWRITGEPDIDYTINVSPGEAEIPINIKWSDTLVISYDILNPGDTVIYKPAPYFNGDIKFYYKVIDNEWAFYGLTLGKIESDSANGYVKIDSIQLEVIGQGLLPTITSATQFIAAEGYPYIFNVGDSVELTVYKSGTLSDSVAWVFLHAPLGDYRSPFENVGTGIWRGTWVPKTTQAHWAWLNVFDIGVLIYKSQLAERDVLWGIPYKVE